MADEYNPPLFYANDKEKLVKALGIQLNCDIKDLQILVNDVELGKSMIIDKIMIIVKKKSA